MYHKSHSTDRRFSIFTGLALAAILALLATAADIGIAAAAAAAEATSIEQELPAAVSIQEYSTGLSQEETADLAFMREEEKLAHDVYLALYDRWGLPVFRNIAASEERHTEAIKALFDSYELNDPAVSDQPGQFANPDLQTLYNALVLDGSQSVTDALLVGAAIEEIDIQDLLEALVHTDQSDITWVYQNLLAGSENHLRAFTRQLERLSGESYSPQYLDLDQFETIVSDSNSRGAGGAMSRGNGRFGRPGGNGWQGR